MLGLQVWHGPLSKMHTKCLHITIKEASDENVKECKKVCVNLDCNTFTFDSFTRRCVFSKCSESTIGLPDSDIANSNVTSYVLIGNSSIY